MDRTSRFHRPAAPGSSRLARSPPRRPPAFGALLDGYPEEILPCDDGYENQCAIRLSIALLGAGFPLWGYTDPLCRHGHARGAQSLARYLWQQIGPGRATRPPGRPARSLDGRTGIVFFQNIVGFRGGLGDHIDLWDGRAALTGSFFDAAEETWFWHIR